MAFTSILWPGLVLGALAVGAVWLILRFLPDKWHPDTDAPIDAIVGGLLIIFAFIVGLTVTLQTSNLSDANTAASNEANSVGELYWYAHALSQPEHSRLQAELRNYTTVVVQQEWPLLGKHRSSAAASAAARTIRFDILSFQPKTATEKAVYPSMLTEVADMFSARRSRVNIATDGGVPPILLEGIWTLSLIMIVVIPLSGKFKKPREYVVFGLFAVFVFASLFFLTDLNNPFAGTVAIQPSAFNILTTGTFKNVP